MFTIRGMTVTMTSLIRSRMLIPVARIRIAIVMKKLLTGIRNRPIQ